MKESKKKVVLAFSGGLDTSFAAKYLSEDLGYEVHTAIANTGGFTPGDLERIEQRAYALGAASHASLDITEDYYNRSIRYMIAGNVLRNGTYPISVSSERIFQAIAIIEYAKKIGADAVAHGSTGAGNDQVRFDLTFQILAPEIEIITPTRDMTLTREYEIDYLQNTESTPTIRKWNIPSTKVCGERASAAKRLFTASRHFPTAPIPVRSRHREKRHSASHSTKAR